ncbi:MAG: carboxypeptidase-like regulatory domain-containing protein [Planctomycetota bacterium]
MRREIITILIMTALVVTAVAVLGPRMTNLPSGTPEQTPSIPLAPVVKPRSMTEAEVTGVDAAPLRIEVLNALTARHVERNVVVDLLLNDGTWLSLARGKEAGEAIPFQTVPLGQPLLLRVRLPGYIESVVGPIVVLPGQSQLVECRLTPLFPVTINLPPEAKSAAGILRVFSTTAPEWPEKQPYAEWLEAGASFMLPPGQYWCQVPRTDPRKHPDYAERGSWLDADWLNRTPGYPIQPESFLFEFEIKDGPMILSPKVEWAVGELSVAGRFLGSEEEPQAGLKVRAIRMGPGPVRELSATAITDDEGRFVMANLRPGVYRIEQDGSSDGEQGIWLGTLREGEPLREIELHTERTNVPRVESASVYGSAEVRILLHGEPVEGAGLQIVGFGTLESWWTELRDRSFAGVTDADGVLKLEDVRSRDYVVRTNHPYSMGVFELSVRAGETANFEFEIAPEGTGALAGHMRYQGADNLRCVLHRLGGGDGLFWYGSDDGKLEVFGLKPGKYKLEAPDTDWFRYEYDLEFKANETLTFEREEVPASVYGELPYPGFWKAGARIEYRDEMGTRPRSWDFSNDPPLGWDEGIRVERVPRRNFSLVARVTYDGRVVGIADVDTSEGDVSQIDWKRLYDAGDSGGDLQVVSSSPPENSPRTTVRVSLDHESLGRVELDEIPMMEHTGSLAAGFVSWASGTWELVFEANGYNTIRQTVVIQPGKTSVVTLEPLPEEGLGNGAHDRPLSGVKIKLPESSPPPPPPRPIGRLRETPVSYRLPPRPQIETPSEGREVWLYSTGADLDELWCAVVHAVDGYRTSTGVVAEQGDLSVTLVQVEGRHAVVVRGLPEGATGISLRLPEHDPVRVELENDQKAYIVEFR